MGPVISGLTTSFLTGIENNAAAADVLATRAQVELAAGIPFVSDDDLKSALDDARVPPQRAEAIVDGARQRGDTCLEGL